MARIAGINIPVHKHAEIGLTSIYGIGRPTAQKICDTVGIAYSKKIKDLTDQELERIREEIGAPDDRGRPAPRDLDQHQAPDGPGHLPRHAPSPRPAGARPTHAHQRAHPQGPEEGRRGAQEVLILQEHSRH